MDKNDSKLLSTINLSFEELKDLKAALDKSAIVAITDSRGIITHVNDRFCQISQYSREELIGQNHRIINSGYHPKSFFKKMWKMIANGETWYGEICNRAKDSSLYWVQTTIVPFLDEQGKPYQFISIRTDITAKKNIKEIAYIAYHDDLTCLPNRHSFTKYVEKEIHHCKQSNSKFALFFIDVNRFKSINDGLGHQVGDMFLKELASRLQSIDHQGNSLFRLHGDEFTYVLKDHTRIDEMAEKIKGTLKDSFIFYDYEFYASISMGISIYPDHGDTPSRLLRFADIAMYAAKRKRDNSYEIYEQNMKGTNDHSLLLETKIHNALHNNLFELHYQPKMNIQKDEMTGMEALIRWYDDDFGYMPPDQFIPFAEQSGLIGIIGEWVLRQALLQIKEWNQSFHTDLKVAVNISSIHFAEESFVPRLKEIIAETDTVPDFLEIEITEITMMDYTDVLIDKIKQLKEMGITVSIDDFGTGYSSLSYLKNFPIDTLKIDRTFIQNITKSKSDEAIVAAIISLAHALNLNVVAEGVEQVEELQLLKAHNCESVQGFYFSKPLNVADFTKKLVTIYAS